MKPACVRGEGEDGCDESGNRCSFLALLSGVTLLQTSAKAAEIRVAATVAPVHSLVSMVADGIVEPAMIVRPGASPHDYALKPSEARALDEAHVVFWVGEGLEPWMAKAVTTLAADAGVIELGGAEGVLRLERREGGIWAAQAPDGGHDGHDHGHGHDGRFDPHLWLAPDNAVRWLAEIAKALATADPPHAEAYRANAEAAAERIETLAGEIDAMLEPVREKPYVVFHDGYQYFEHRFELQPIGAVSLSDADRPGPARLIEIREAIAESGAVCAFAEPQFTPKLIDTVIEGSDVRTGSLDPIGAGLQPGAGLYPALLRGLAENLLECLG